MKPKIKKVKVKMLCCSHVAIYSMSNVLKKMIMDKITVGSAPTEIKSKL